MGLWPTSASAALAEPAFLLNATSLFSRIGSKLSQAVALRVRVVRLLD